MNKTANKKNNPMKDYDPTDRDFQRTKNDIDSISASERDEEIYEQKHGKVKGGKADNIKSNKVPVA